MSYFVYAVLLVSLMMCKLGEMLRPFKKKKKREQMLLFQCRKDGRNAIFWCGLHKYAIPLHTPDFRTPTWKFVVAVANNSGRWLLCCTSAHDK